MSDAEANLRAAERVASLLVENGVPAVVIGAVALAAYRYVRHTEDIDLGVDADLPKMRTLAAALRDEGFVVDFHEPDGDDPLGGMIDVSGPFGVDRVGRPAVVKETATRFHRSPSASRLPRGACLPVWPLSMSCAPLRRTNKWVTENLTDPRKCVQLTASC